MSRSNDTNVPNPATRFFGWSGSDGTLSYYDKKSESNVVVPLPFTFLLLDTLSTIKGFSETDDNGIYSNEVRNTQTEKLTVKVFKGGTIASGFYKEIKDQVVSAGGKYAQSCYIAFHNEEKQLVIGNISFHGSSFGGGKNKKENYEVTAWMEFSTKNKADLMKKAIVMEKDDRLCVLGATKFYCPKFRFKDVTDETNAKANELDKELQAYLTAYFARTGTENFAPETMPIAPQSGDPMVNYEPKDNTKTEEPHIIGEQEDDLPF